MAYVDNDGIRIHYQVEGDGPPLVMQHGYTDSIETWYELGYVDALKKGHRLILVDARGHGASDKPHDTAAYANDLRVADIVAVLRELNIPRADYFGYSRAARGPFPPYGERRCHRLSRPGWCATTSSPSTRAAPTVWVFSMSCRP
jgi:pimeloyl-ACP methyl ester carboxylesterase